jgi:flavin reductase (DIM6/NTAB) family NADH-FMN oxidoreductase RutF
MGNLAASVTVVTTFGEDSEPLGLTVSAFSSVSLDPPIVLVCIDKGARCLPALLDRGGFTVNFLTEGHGEIAITMASRSADKFDGVEYEQPAHDVAGPVLTIGTFAHFQCRTRETVDAGDHWVLLADVLGGTFTENHTPLVYYHRSFVTIK